MSWVATVDVKALMPDKDPSEITVEDLRKFSADVDSAFASTIFKHDVNLRRVLAGMKACENVYEFNEKWLNQLYDWADGRRVWLGL